MAEETSSFRLLRLIELCNKVPETADLIVRKFQPMETQALMTVTDPGLTAFCEGAGGGIERLMKISYEGKNERRRRSRLPSPSRLLIEEWQKRLIGKRLIEDDEEGDDITFKRSDIPKPWRFRPGSTYFRYEKNRLNIWMEKGRIKWVVYG